MSAVANVDILANNLRLTANKMRMKIFIFQQDNVPKHTSRLAKNYFIEKKIELLSWPPQSLDLNQIETLSAIKKQKLS